MDAISFCKTTISNFVINDSSVYAAALEISKVFDSVNHFKLFYSLLSARIPASFMSIICNCYSKHLLLPVETVVYRSQLALGSLLSSSILNIILKNFVLKLRH